MARFNKTFCSSCGGEFGPGDSGFSHCDQHASLANRDELSPTVQRVMTQFDSALTRRRHYAPSSTH
jgi:hypothetical protein